MTRLAVRRRRSTPPLTLPQTAGMITLGLAVGTAVGFLISELWGPSASHPLAPARAPRSPDRTSIAERVQAAHEALLVDAEVSACDIDVVPVGRDALEIHGWVPTRQARARALRLVRAAVGESRLIDSLRVRGEDDVAESDAPTDVRSA